jgi:IS5 family transposase
VETYLRLMFLKFRYLPGYELLCREVADSISWQRFCKIPLGTRVPHPTTLMKITSRCGDLAGRVRCTSCIGGDTRRRQDRRRSG